MLMLSRVSWHSTACFTHSPFALQSAGIPNHVVWEHSMYQTTYTHSTNHLQHHSTKGHHDTLYGSITLPFNSQVLAIFFPFATIPATPHYPVSTDRYFLQYGMLTFLLHSMTNTFFFLTFSLFLLPFRFHLISHLFSQSSPVHP